MAIEGITINPLWVQDVTAGLTDASRLSPELSPPFIPHEMRPLVEQGPANYGEILELMCGGSLPPAMPDSADARRSYRLAVDPVTYAARALFSTMLAVTEKCGNFPPETHHDDSAEDPDDALTDLLLKARTSAKLFLEAEKSPLLAGGTTLTDIRARDLVELADIVNKCLFKAGLATIQESSAQEPSTPEIQERLMFLSSRCRLVLGTTRFMRPFGVNDYFEMTRRAINKFPPSPDQSRFVSYFVFKQAADSLTTGDFWLDSCDRSLPNLRNITDLLSREKTIPLNIFLPSRGLGTTCCWV